MKLYLTVSAKTKYDRWSMLFERDMPWVVPPNVGEMVFLGKRNREKRHINASVTLRVFDSDRIEVEAEIRNCGEEYVSLCEFMVNDGFKKVSASE